MKTVNNSVNQAKETTSLIENTNQSKLANHPSFSDFNSIAPFYDIVQKIVFGNRLQRAQKYFISEFLDAKNVLIIGGGTGEILESFSGNTHLNSITFIEQSIKMIEKAKSRNVGVNVNFVCDDIFKWKSEQQFDLIILPFILDVFTTQIGVGLVQKLKPHLNSNGSVLFTDFVETSKQNSLLRLLIPIMYSFFKLTAKMKVDHLPNFDLMFERTGFEEVKRKEFVKGLVQSRIYQDRFME